MGKTDASSLLFWRVHERLLVIFVFHFLLVTFSGIRKDLSVILSVGCLVEKLKLQSRYTPLYDQKEER
eukprot:m.391954 g.391954  ORF g.391954 m.391954 type:complete len:68 (+) comp56348_c0_seq2:1488-1691(+)